MHFLKARQTTIAAEALSAPLFPVPLKQNRSVFSKVFHQFLSRIHFYEMHIFKYSIRQGTRAADMPDQVPEEVKTARSAQLMELSEKMSLEFREHYLDSEQEVLFEELCQVDGEDYYTGYTKEYVKIGVKSKDHLENVIKSGKIIGKISTDILLMGE